MSPAMQHTLNLPDSFGAHRTLFVTAGTPAAVLVSRQGPRQRKRTLRFPDAPAALAWALAHAANMVYIANPTFPNN